MKQGIFVVTDGLDGVGKGVVIDALIDYEREKGKKVFDLVPYWKKHRSHPDHKLLSDYDVIVSAEPTWAGIGADIREELITKGSTYSALATAHAYSLDRLILYKKLLIPALEHGKIWLQSRAFSTSMIYQPVQAKMQGDELSLKDILALPGNVIAQQHAPDLFIITIVDHPEIALHRSYSRNKKDRCKFETLAYQLKFQPRFKSRWFRKRFEDLGTKVEYLDASISVEHTRAQAVGIWERYLQSISRTF